LTASPLSGTAPSIMSVQVNPAGLAVGTHTGLITICSPGLPPQTVRVVVRITADPRIVAVVNAASFHPGMVPGGLSTLFGRNLSVVSGTEFPGGATSHKGTWVEVEGRRTPLLGVSKVGDQEQVNFQVPFELGAPALARVIVNNNGATAVLTDVPLYRVQPGLFEWVSPGGVRYTAAVKTDGSVVEPGNPASPGEVVSLFLTGMGPILPVLGTGEPGPADPPAETWLKPVVNVGGLPAQVLFSGYAPGFLGLYQVNLLIPEGLSAAAAKLEVIVEGVASQSSLILIR